MYAPVVLNPKSEQWFSQSQTSTLHHYDYNAIMAMPYMEESSNHRQFYLDLIAQAKNTTQIWIVLFLNFKPSTGKTIVKFPAKNWQKPCSY